MSEPENFEDKSKKSPIAIIFLILMIIIGFGFLSYTKNKNNNIETTNITAAEDTVNNSTKKIDTNSSSPDQIIDSEYDIAPDFDLEKAATPRILGDVNAPIKISEHSSFTCSHCARFHETNFKKIKADYIDTGKAYIVFDDFPLNQYDLYVGAVARCINDDAYFNFIQLMFETQKDWVSENYLSYLKQNAKLTGASEAQINNCLNSTELHDRMSQSRAIAMEKHKVKSTPTLVINDTIVIPALSDYSKIKEALDAELAKTAE